MRPHLVIPSTTSHKQEPLLPTLEIFARLGMHDLDLNLNHIVERGVAVESVERALAANGQRVWIVSGGWCDFFDASPKSRETDASVASQVALARAVRCRSPASFLRAAPFRVGYADGDDDGLAPTSGGWRTSIATSSSCSRTTTARLPGPEVCRDILEAVDRPNVRLNFDPINFEVAGTDSCRAFATLRPLIAHVHLKGLDHRTRFCEFGSGSVDLTPLLRALLDGGLPWRVYGGVRGTIRSHRAAL